MRAHQFAAVRERQAHGGGKNSDAERTDAAGRAE